MLSRVPASIPPMVEAVPPERVARTVLSCLWLAAPCCCAAAVSGAIASAFFGRIAAEYIAVEVGGRSNVAFVTNPVEKPASAPRLLIPLLSVGIADPPKMPPRKMTFMSPPFLPSRCHRRKSDSHYAPPTVNFAVAMVTLKTCWRRYRRKQPVVVAL